MPQYYGTTDYPIISDQHRIAGTLTGKNVRAVIYNNDAAIAAPCYIYSVRNPALSSRYAFIDAQQATRDKSAGRITYTKSVTEAEVASEAQDGGIQIDPD